MNREGKPALDPKIKAKMQAPIIDAFERGSTAYADTALVGNDGVIDPRDTRDVLGMAISVAMNAPKMGTGYGVFRM